MLVLCCLRHFKWPLCVFVFVRHVLHIPHAYCRVTIRRSGQATHNNGRSNLINIQYMCVCLAECERVLCLCSSCMYTRMQIDMCSRTTQYGGHLKRSSHSALSTQNRCFTVHVSYGRISAGNMWPAPCESSPDSHDSHRIMMGGWLRRADPQSVCSNEYPQKRYAQKTE